MSTVHARGLVDGRSYEVRGEPVEESAARAVYHGRRGGEEVSFVLVRAQDAADVERFLAGAAAQREIQHPNVVQVHDYGQLDDGSPFLVTARFGRESLGGRLARRGRLTTAEVLVMLGEAARGVQALHDARLVLGDLSPDNVWIRIVGAQRERAEVTGLHLAQPPAHVAYAAPEELLEQPHADPRSDLWSLGVMLYEALTGALPFVATHTQDVRAAILHERTPAVARHRFAQASVERLVQRALEKDPRLRFATAGQLADRIDQELEALAQIGAEETLDEELWDDVTDRTGPPIDLADSDPDD